MLDLQKIYPEHLKESIIIDSVVYNSKEASATSVFVALTGTKTDGHLYVKNAFEQGAKVAIVEKKIEGLNGVQIVVEDSHFVLSEMSSILYETTETTMSLIGITGTDGKTSTASIIEKMLLAYKQRVGYIGTNGIRYDGVTKNLQCTTPLAPELHEIIADMSRRKVKALAMEVSSHALATKRVEHLAFDYGIFTNFSHDHLDFHHTLEAYALAKKHLFYLLKKDGLAIINFDDELGREIYEECQKKKLSYGFSPEADISATNIHYSMRGMHFDLVYKNEHYPIDTKLIGHFNVSNILAAVAVLLDMNISMSIIQNLIASVEPVEGRMELFHNAERNISAIVDFAHAPNSIEQVIKAARLLTKGTITVVTGAVGDGDIEKRPMMGEVTVRKADRAIFTTDQPYSEDPKTIITEMIETLSDNEVYQIIVSREEAIKYALDTAGAFDVVLILGKGRETKIVYDTYEIAFSDYEYVKRYMEQTK